MSFLVGTTTTTTITATATATDPTPTTSDVSYLRDMSPVERSLKHVTVLHLQCHNISPKRTTNTKQTLHSMLSSIEIHSNDFLHKLSILSKHFHSQHITYSFFSPCSRWNCPKKQSANNLNGSPVCSIRITLCHLRQFCHYLGNLTETKTRKKILDH